MQAYVTNRLYFGKFEKHLHFLRAGKISLLESVGKVLSAASFASTPPN